MAFWLVKSEPGVYSIADLKRDKATLWSEIRNYQARNYLKQMQVGDRVLFYHSGAEPPGIAGLCEVSQKAIADPTQFDKKSDYWDQTASKDEPRWFAPQLRFKAQFRELISISELRKLNALSKMPLLQRGSRLSVMPVTAGEYKEIMTLRRGLI